MSTEPLKTKPLSHCLCCGGSDLIKYLDLGKQPPPNAFHREGVTVTLFPLETAYCKTCFHSQLTEAVNPDILFQEYTYRTGVSRTLTAYYQELARAAVAHRNVTQNVPLEVLDIGCNDGTLLDAFRALHCKTYGVDPCDVLPQDTPHCFLRGYWNQQTSQDFDDQQFDIITATNVLAHNDNPIEFIKASHRVLKDYGVMILEFPYAKDLLSHCEFDTIYHEHISYFLLSPITHLLDHSGFYISDIQNSPIHGGSLRIYLSKCLHGGEHLRMHPTARKLIAQELELGLLSESFYQDFQNRVNLVKFKIQTTVDMLRGFRTPQKLIGFGASGKGTVFLNFCELDLDYIIDETPIKQGKLSPGRNIPVVPLEKLSQETSLDLNIVVMAWNCFEECLYKIQSRRSDDFNDHILLYVPQVRRFPVWERESNFRYKS